VKYELIPLGELGEIVSGSTPDTTNNTYWGGGIPWITPADLTNHEGVYFTGNLRKITEAGYKSCSTTMIRAGSILFSSRAPIGHCAVTTFPLCTNQGFKSIVPYERLNVVYGFFALKYFTPQIEALGRGATFTEVNKEIFESFSIPLPPLPEQQRIAAILQKADRLRSLRRYAHRLSDGYLQSVFLEMFGDPGKNPHKWSTDRLGNIVNINPPGHNALPQDLEVSFIPMAAVDDISATIIIYDKRKVNEVSKGYTPFIEGDVLFAKITPCMENGKAAIATGLCNRIGFGSTEFHVLRPAEKTTADWILQLVRRQEFRNLAAMSFTGTAGQQRVPTSFLEDFFVPIPPLEVQNQFAKICEEHKIFTKRVVESSRQAEHLFQSLLGRAFAGEL
jgi:type I restriction enzyme S subunit